MKYKYVKYGILLTREQLDFLKDDNQGFHRMKAFDTFLSLAAIEPFHYEKKNFSADLGIGQFAISKVELAELWHCDRKTAQKMIDLFNEVGIFTSVANNRTTIHTIHCLAFWFVDGQDAPSGIRITSEIQSLQNWLSKVMPVQPLLMIMATAILNRLYLPIPFHLWLMPKTMKGKRTNYLHTERMDSCQKTIWCNLTSTMPSCRQKSMRHMSLPITPHCAILPTSLTAYRALMKMKARQIHLSRKLPI